MISTGAGSIVDDDLLLPCFGKFRANHARQNVGRASGQIGDNEADGFRGVVAVAGPASCSGITAPGEIGGASRLLIGMT